MRSQKMKYQEEKWYQTQKCLPPLKSFQTQKILLKHSGWNMTLSSMSPDEGNWGWVTWWEQDKVGPNQRPEWKLFESFRASPESHLPYLHEAGFCFCITLQTLGNQQVSQTIRRKALVLQTSQAVIWPLIVVHSLSSPVFMEHSSLGNLVLQLIKIKNKNVQ